MSNWNTSERSAREQERRRLYQDQIPDRWCPRCKSLAYEGDDACFRCERERPAAGWPELADSVDPWLGKVLTERYLITGHLATGASSRIYIADSRVIPRSFAIKVMDVSQGPDLDRDELRKRLKREVEALGTLRNPHIVSFYDVLELGDRHVGFVMDLIQGASLGDLVAAEGPLPLARAVELTRQVANGIFEAHQRSLLHRCLKPSNVMVETLPAGDDFARILDFGVMWVRGTVHGTGAFDNTPLFASPEQIADEDLDVRSDLYGIGALLFFMLTGTPPFEEDSGMADLDVLMHQPAPTLEDVVGREFPAAVEALVSKLLAKERERRPGDIAELLDWLDEIRTDLDNGPVTVEIDEILMDTSASSTSMGMVPTLGDSPSPVLRVEPSEMSEISEASVEQEQFGTMGCLGEGYAFVRGDEVVWAGSFFGHAKIDPSLTYTSLAVIRDKVLLGTSDGRIFALSPGDPSSQLFEDPRQAAITSVALGSTGLMKIAGSGSGRLYVARGDSFVRMGAGEDPVSALALGGDGGQFAIARGSNIQIMHANASNLSSFPAPVDEPVVSMAFSPDNYLIAVLTESGVVVLESVHTGQEFMRIDTGNPDLAAVTFSSDNNLMGLFRDANRVVLKKIT